MAHEPSPDSSGVLGALLAPLRLPGRVVADVETASRAILGLKTVIETHLVSLDERAGRLIDGVGGLQAAVGRIEGQIEQLMSLESTIESRMDGLRDDLNARMLEVRDEVHAMSPPMDQMARDVQKINNLLPEPGDSPFARLKDTLSPS